MTWGCLKTLWLRSKGAYGVNTSSWAKSVGSCVPLCLVVVPTPNCAAYGAGIKTCPRVCSARCPSAPGSSGSGAWVWRCWSRYGATPPAKARPHAVAGSGPGWAMTRSSKSMARSWAWWAPGGVGRSTGCSPVLLASYSSWSSAMANWWCPSTLPFAGPIPRGLEDRVGTNCTGYRASWMDGWQPSADAVWHCHLLWSSQIVGSAIRSSCATPRPHERICAGCGGQKVSMRAATLRLRTTPSTKGKWATGLICCIVTAMRHPFCKFAERVYHIGQSPFFSTYSILS
jgi:hypothetical protein